MAFRAVQALAETAAFLEREATWRHVTGDVIGILLALLSARPGRPRPRRRRRWAYLAGWKGDHRGAAKKLETFVDRFPIVSFVLTYAYRRSR
jgi:hypothetical protein